MPAGDRYTAYKEFTTQTQPAARLGAARIQNFIKHFNRDPLGTWVCISEAELMLPQGRVQVTIGSRFAKGTKFMNVDLASLLEEQYWKDQAGRRE